MNSIDSYNEIISLVNREIIIKNKHISNNFIIPGSLSEEAKIDFYKRFISESTDYLAYLMYSISYILSQKSDIDDFISHEIEKTKSDRLNPIIKKIIESNLERFVIDLIKL